MSLPKEIIKGSLRFFILRTLIEKSHYGYSLAKAIRKNSKDLLKAGEGSLYPALYKLESEGLIVSKWDESYSPKRKYYFITDSGKKFVEEESDNWKSFIELIKENINLSV